MLPSAPSPRYSNFLAIQIPRRPESDLCKARPRHRARPAPDAKRRLTKPREVRIQIGRATKRTAKNHSSAQWKLSRWDLGTALLEGGTSQLPTHGSVEINANAPPGPQVHSAVFFGTKTHVLPPLSRLVGVVRGLVSAFTDPSERRRSDGWSSGDVPPAAIDGW